MRKNLIMKWIFILLFPTLLFSQNNCKYEFEEKTDSTYLRILPEKLIFEKVFGTTRELITFKLIQNNGVPTLSIQTVVKNSLFIPSKCFDLSSRIIFQLENGKYVTLKSIDENVCSTLSYNEEDKANIRVLSGYFVFTKTNYEELKKSPISIIRVQYAGEKVDYNVKSEFHSEILNETFYPSKYFMEYLKCVE